MRALFLGLLVALPLHADPVVVSGTEDNDYESWIARLGDDRLMVVFDRNPDFRSGDLYVTFSTDDGQTWDSARPIVTGPADQPLPCFVELPGDSIRLWYSSNENGYYRIYSAWSLDGLVWNQEGIVPLGWPASAANYYDPTVVVEPDSSLTMFYSVQSSGAYVAHCPNRGTWDTLRTLVGPTGMRPRIMKHSNGTYLAAYQRRSGPGQYDIDIFIRTSLDRVNWTAELRLTTNLNSHDAFCLETPDSSFLVYYAKCQGGLYNIWYQKSGDGVNWEPEVQVTSDPVRNTQPHVFFERGDACLVYAHATAYPENHDVYFWRLPYLGLFEPAPLATRPGTVMPTVAATELLSRSRNPVVLDVTGRNIEPRAASAGTYFIVNQAGPKSSWKKVLVLR